MDSDEFYAKSDGQDFVEVFEAGYQNPSLGAKTRMKTRKMVGVETR